MATKPQISFEPQKKQKTFVPFCVFCGSENRKWLKNFVFHYSGAA